MARKTHLAYIATTRESLSMLLASGATRKQLECRANSLRRLAEDCARFFPWPALHDSLTADCNRVRDEALRRHR